MCGIVGLFTKQEQTLPINISEMLRSVELLHHRGPDAQQAAVIREFGDVDNYVLPKWFSHTDYPLETALGFLGHTRLKIIDPSDKANQPFEYTAPNGYRYVLSYNGEIYNYRELRDSLRARGYEFQTDCDTEVIPALYDAYGSGMLSDLNGMFAFALWDVSARKLFLARDRYGIKPLYVIHLADGSLAFASEVKSLLAFSAIPKVLNSQALYEHFTFQFSLKQQTLLKHVTAFPAGHWATYQVSSGRYTCEAYWEPEFRTTQTKSQSEWLEATRACLEQSVRSQLLGDVPIGSFLSGGLDTGAISAIAAQSIPGLYTLTCGFDVSGLEGFESYFDERQQARQLSELLKTNHHELMITSDTLPGIFDDVVWHLDDFQAGISYQNFAVSRLVNQHVTVVLSGVGGDELFAGYPWRYQGALSADMNPFQKQFYGQCARILDDEIKRDLLAEPLLANLQEPDTSRLFENALSSIQAETPLQKALGFDMRYFLQALLTVEDRLSMAHSVESRVPFLDNRLVDLALSMPDALKLREEDGVLQSKYILRKALSGLLPPDVLQARKQGFTPPDASWYRGPLKPWVETILLGERFLSRGIFKPEAIRRILDEHQAAQRNHRFLIWSLLCLESWHRQFMDTNTPTLPHSALSGKLR